MEIRTRTIDGAFWNIGLALSNKIVTLAGQIALAWFLLPADMGLANLALATVAFTAVLSVGGLGDVLLQRRRYEEEAGQALWLSFIFCLIVGLVIAGLAMASAAMGRPAVRGLMLVLALGTVLGAPATVLAAGLKNRLDFKGLALCQMAGGLFYTSAAVFLAWLGWGPYALIVPCVPQQWVCMGAMMWRGSRPAWARPDWSILSSLLKPTLALSITGLFVGLQTQVPVFVCGWILNPTSLGHFSWGWAVAGQTVFLLAMNMREVLFPAFTRLKNDPKHRATVAMKAARAITATLCIVCGAQALVARPMIEFLVPSKWQAAIPVVICASLGFVAQGLWISGMAWLNACGEYRKLLKLSGFQAIAAGTLTWLGLRFLGGLTGASIGCAAATILGAIASVLPMGIQFLLKAGRSWWRPLGATILLWPICLWLAWGCWYKEFCVAAIFMASAGWFWWREDDGGLSDIFARMAGATGLIRRSIGGSL